MQLKKKQDCNCTPELDSKSDGVLKVNTWTNIWQPTLYPFLVADGKTKMLGTSMVTLSFYCLISHELAVLPWHHHSLCTLYRCLFHSQPVLSNDAWHTPVPACKLPPGAHLSPPLPISLGAWHEHGSTPSPNQLQKICKIHFPKEARVVKPTGEDLHSNTGDTSSPIAVSDWYQCLFGSVETCG